MIASKCSFLLFRNDTDSKRMSSLNSESDSHISDNPSVHSVHIDLEIAWSRVVGEPSTDGMDESQLVNLCTELGLGQLTQADGISELFAALDHDSDGYVMFWEFSEQMSKYLGTHHMPESKALGNSTPDTTNSESHLDVMSCLVTDEDEQSVTDRQHMTVKSCETSENFSDQASISPRFVGTSIEDSFESEISDFL